MNIWENAVITDKGISLLTRLVEGNTLKLTRAVAGSHFVNFTLLREQEDISEPKQTLTFREITYPDKGKLCLPCYLTNDELETGYTAMQIGIFAEDPDYGEILFFIAQAERDTGTIVPNKNESPGYSAEWTFYLQIEQAENITLTVDPTHSVNQVIMERYVMEYVADEILALTADEIDEVTPIN